MGQAGFSIAERALEPASRPCGPACPGENELLDLLAGARDGAAAETLRVHIDGCEDCRAAGDTIRLRDEPARALPYLERARMIYARTRPVDHPDSLELEASLGATLCSLERWDECITVLDAALALLPEGRSGPEGREDQTPFGDRRAEVSANLGEALGESGRDRALALVKSAALALRAADPATADDLDRWLAARQE